MYKKLLSLFLCLISIIFANNPALAIEKNQTNIDRYKPELTSFMNISENSEPIYLARERKTREDGSSGAGQMSLSWIGSIFITGLGQILLGEVWRGLAFMAVLIIGATIMGFTLYTYSEKAFWWTTYGIIIQLASAVDAFFVAKYKSENSEEEARLLNEKIAQIETTLKKVSISNSQLNYNIVSF